MQSVGSVAPAGTVGLRVVRAGEPVTSMPARALTSREIIRYGFPNRTQPSEVQAWKAANVRHLWRGWKQVALARALRLPHFYGQLSLQVFKADGQVFDLGLVSLRVVTDVGVAFIVDAFQNLVELETMKYHALGTGSTAEAAGDTALVTELTTEYTGNVRATGTTAETSAPVYSTVATNTLDGTPGAALREHGIFSANAAGVLFDRTVFAAITLVSGDALQSSYALTLTAGS